MLNLAWMARHIVATQDWTWVSPYSLFVTPAQPGAGLAGTLLVAAINCPTTPNRFQAPASWVQAMEVNLASAGRTEIWYYPNNPGGIASATFTINPANISCDAQMTEWSGVATAAPRDQTGSATNVLSGSLTVSTAGAMAQSDELVITAD